MAVRFYWVKNSANIIDDNYHKDHKIHYFTFKKFELVQDYPR